MVWPGCCAVEVLRGLGVLAAERRRAWTRRRSGCWRPLRITCFVSGPAAGRYGGYVGHARRFLAGLLAGEFAVTAADVTGAVLRESQAVSVCSAQYFVAGMRSFLRFCFIEGLMEADLSRRRWR